MSGYFVLNSASGGDAECDEFWNPSLGVLHWLFEVLIESARNEELVEFVRGQLEAGSGFLVLSNFDEAQRPEVLRVIREDFLPATEKAYPGMGAVDMARELVEMEKRWSVAMAGLDAESGPQAAPVEEAVSAEEELPASGAVEEPARGRLARLRRRRT